MKIHGTAKGGALSKKDFGVAFAKSVTPSSELWSVTGTGQADQFNNTESISILAQRFQTGHELIGQTITRFDASIKKIGSPTGNITGRIINSSNEEQLNLGTLDSSTLSSSYETKTFENTDGYELENGDRLALYFTTDNDSNTVNWSMNTSSESNTNGSYFTGSWTERSRDFTMSVWGY